MKIDNLLNSNPFEFTKESNELFFESLRECSQYHYDGCDYFKFLWDKVNIRPADIRTDLDLSRMPFIMVNLFKTHELRTGPKDDIVLTLGSSGTGGQRSLIYLNQESLDRVKKLAFNIHQELGMTSDKKYNYLCFTYDPEIANDLGTAFTDELLTSFTGKEEVFYTFKHNGEDFYFDEEATVETLKRFEKSEYGTRILGFPAFLYQILDKYNINLNLGEDSWVQTGGGWKGQADKEIPKKEFRKLVSSRLGLPIENIRDLFGMVEHGIPYVDYKDGELRIPNYARVLIRDPKTLEVLPNGKKGLIQFICTYNTSYPSMSLLTTDWGVKEETKEMGSILTILGRAGISKNKGCAIKAAEMLS
jgi:phenylacetate-coenzyme A ligase PaaK-like adenylate-forming protein